MSKITVKKKTENFTILDNTGLRDETLSWKAKGLLAYLLHLPDDWHIYISDLKNRSKDGKTAVSAGLKELIESGYVKRNRIHENGKFKRYDYEIYEIPQKLENQKTENLKTEKQKTENMSLLNTNTTKELKEVITKQTKEKNILNKQTFDDEVDKLNISDFLKESFKEWFDYKKEIKNPVKTMLSITKILNQIGKEYTDEKHIADSIDFSICKEYKGIYPKKINNDMNTNRNINTKKEINWSEVFDK